MEFNNDPVELALSQLASRLRRTRLNANLSQRELASRAGVSLKTLSNAEDGRNVSLETLLRLLQALGRLSEVSRLVDVDGPSPVELASRRGRLRQRARASEAPDDDPEWRW